MKSLFLISIIFLTSLTLPTLSKEATSFWEGNYLSIGLAASSPESIEFTDGANFGEAYLYGQTGRFFDEGEIDVGAYLRIAAGGTLKKNMRVQYELSAMTLNYLGNTNYSRSGELQPSSAKVSVLGFLLSGYHNLGTLYITDGFHVKSFIGAGIGVNVMSLEDYVQSFPFPDDPSGYLRKGPAGEIPETRLPNGKEWEQTLMLTVGIEVPVAESTHLEIAYRYTTARSASTDKGNLNIVRYREDGSRREINVPLNETTTDFPNHSTSFTFRFTF